MDNLEIAKALFGNSGNTSNSRSGGQTTTCYGIATSDSVNGSVRVNLGGETTSTDDDQTIEVDTTFAVYEGDEVIISLVGADGTGKAPCVIGVVGRGDQQQTEIDTAMDLATEANGAAAVGKITPQHFFHNSNGAFVTSDNVVCDTFNGDGATLSFPLTETIDDGGVLAVYVAGASVTSGYSVSSNVLTFDTAPTGSIVCLYSVSALQNYSKIDSSSFDVVQNGDTVASFGKEITVGTRDTSAAKGIFSQTYGEDCVASAPYSTARGYQTVAASQYQTVEGRLNIEDNIDQYAFIVGNGASPRSVESFTTDGATDTFALAHSAGRTITDVYGYISGSSDTDFRNTGFNDYVNVWISNDGEILWITTLQALPAPVTVSLEFSVDGGYAGSWQDVLQEQRTFGIVWSGRHFVSIDSATVKFNTYPIRGMVSIENDEAVIDGFPYEFDGLKLDVIYNYDGTVTRANALAVDWNGDLFAFGKIANRMGTAMVVSKLWENASPTSNFAAQTLSMSLAEFDWLIILCQTSTTGTGRSIQFIEKGEGTMVLNVPNVASTQYFYKRTATLTDNSITFSTGYRNTNATAGTNYCIPCVIYGISFH